ncbi:hypothetical protein EV421DRAFT_1833222 [Armillaria borealis]|uniref:Uncharacterized protein n=1 Tax=Armillaria borealis TaxID=47425 RepID=A0AA39J8F4_9AGAR|nr:hypothetical protein EV421DRAFT_1833222 [Armillaria borealis]
MVYFRHDIRTALLFVLWFTKSRLPPLPESTSSPSDFQGQHPNMYNAEVATLLFLDYADLKVGKPVIVAYVLTFIY